MSLFGMAFLGMIPFGSLLCGSLASRFGAPMTFGLCGVICLITAYLFFRKLRYCAITSAHLRKAGDHSGGASPLRLETHSNLP